MLNLNNVAGELSFETYRKYIEETNAAFKQMSPRQKRVQIAKDVIASLDAKRIKAEAGVYVSGEYQNLPGEAYSPDWIETRDALDESDAREQLLSGKIKCTVCAIGSVFTCAVDRMNKLNTREVRNTSKTRIMQYLDGTFSGRQLDLMEVAFECTGRNLRQQDPDDYPDFEPNTDEISEDEVERAITFGQAWPTPEWRMRAIMMNVIAHGGEFEP